MQQTTLAIEKAPGLKRRLGLATATALVVGEVIGVGIFLTPAGHGQIAGLAVLAPGGLADDGCQRDRRRSLLRCAGGCVIPEAGGGYVYLKEAYGPRVAFLYGWLSLLVTDPGLDRHAGRRSGELRRVPRSALALGAQRRSPSRRSLSWPR